MDDGTHAVMRALRGTTRYAKAGAKAKASTNGDTPVVVHAPVAASRVTRQAVAPAFAPTRGDVPDPRDPMFTPPNWHPTPAWLTELRAHQWDAAVEVVENYASGKRFVFLDAPTGTGKTVIGDLVARMLKKHAVYMCSTKSLQDQVLADFPYARILKGRANYPTMFKPHPLVTADDCNGHAADDDCDFCEPMAECPYRIAKRQAVTAQLSVLNYAYWLREVNFVTKPAFSRPPKDGNTGGFFICDECDTLEDQLMRFVELYVPGGRLRELHVTPPKKGSHRNTIAKWMQDELAPAIERAIGSYRGTVDAERRARGWARLLEDVTRVAPEYLSDNWLRDNDAGPLALKPIRVAPYGQSAVWRHMGLALLMSASVVSADFEIANLGLDEDLCAVVSVPMTFAKENRVINIAPVASTKGGAKECIKNGEADKLARGIVNIARLHTGERMLVHTVSYQLAGYLLSRCRRAGEDMRVLLTYERAGERDAVLATFRATPGAVLFAPSFDRGIDLKDDDCRVVVIAKVPYPNIGDSQVSARAHAKDGREWMDVTVARSVVQMTGRAVRSETDWCETYIIDKQMVKFYRQNRRLFPAWWNEAVNTRFNTRPLLQG